MPTELKTSKAQVHVECPVGQDLLRLRFDVTEPKFVKVTLRFLPSGWTWKEEVGLVRPGDPTAEVELAGMPGGPYVLVAEFYEADRTPYIGAAEMVAAHGVRTLLAALPYICS